MTMPAEAGYSGTPLPQKLGLKDGQRVLFLDLPESLGELAASRNFAEMRRTGWDGLAEAEGFDFVHGFTASRAVLEDAAKPFLNAIRRDGMVWISWPKKASKVPTDITEDVIREVLLPTGLVDVKVAAVDAVWSGLKLVIRKELR
ncbi:hypothetical protein JP74_04975 [Devosia sp. 17-2-E-8]|nr:hypothetical protein JP74_04975 [Devosia sp. 17-2-E-8]